MSLSCLALGVLAVLDVTQGEVPVAAYLAVPLGVVGLGLVVGAWLGRARWLIFPGAALTVALVIVTSAESWNMSHADIARGSRMWTPTSVESLDSSYSVDVGSGTLDLSQISFPANSPVSVDVHVDLGNLVVILPPNVDVDVSAMVDGGSADVLGQRWDGLDNDPREVHDNGTDGPGGGTLRLTATVDLGKLEVHR
jgi:hypothetical protein